VRKLRDGHAVNADRRATLREQFQYKHEKDAQATKPALLRNRIRREGLTGLAGKVGSSHETAMRLQTAEFAAARDA
jgi:hypothetical protein